MKQIFTIFAAIIVTANVFAQSPEKMSYQAVIRDASGTLVTTQVGMKLSVLKGDNATTATEEYSETLTPTPNANGLVNVELGGQTGWDAIDWADGKFFIKTETDVDNDGTYDVEGISQLLSVPYALHAKTAESITGDINEVDGSVTNELQTLSVSNDTIYLSNGGFAKIPTQQPQTYAVGDSAQGGLVFYVNEAGTHGLVIALTDQAYDGSDINTMVYYNEISSLCSDPNNFDEAGKEYSDWHLPSIAEVELLQAAFQSGGDLYAATGIVEFDNTNYSHLYWLADVLFLDELVDYSIGCGQTRNTAGYRYSDSSDKNLVRRCYGTLNARAFSPQYSEIEYSCNVRCVRSF
jgi:hypothetical protein